MRDNKDNSNIVQATCKRCYLDEIGDIEKVTIEEVATGHTRTVSASVLVEAIASGKIVVHGIAVNKDGELYKTSRPNNKRPINPKKSKLLSIVKKIKLLEMEAPSTRRTDEISKLKRELIKLQKDDSYRDQYELLIKQEKTNIFL